MILRTEQTDRRAGLGEAVRIREVDRGEEPHRALDHRSRHAAAPVRDRAQRRGPRLARALQIRDDARQHGGNEERLRCTLGGCELEPRSRIELGQDHHAPPGIGRGQERRDPGDVIRRHRDQRSLLFARAAELHRRKHVGAQVTVTEHGRLGCTGRAAREELDCDRVRVQITGAVRRGSRGLIAQQHVAVDRQRPGGQPQILKLRRRSNDQRCIESCKQRLDLAAAQAIVDRGVGQLGPRRGIHRHRRRWTVDVEKRDRAGALFPQPPLGGRGEPAKLVVREASSGAAHGGAHRPRGRGHVEQDRGIHRAQSDEGSAFACLTGIATPSRASDPSPPRVHSTSTRSAVST